MSEGGFGANLGFPILIDRDLKFSASLGLARSSTVQLLVKAAVFCIRECGSPAKATVIVDKKATLRYMAAHRTNIHRCLI